MIKDPLLMTATDKLFLVGEVFLKIALNFWWVLVLFLIVAVTVRLQETNIRD